MSYSPRDRMKSNVDDTDEISGENNDLTEDKVNKDSSESSVISEHSSVLDASQNAAFCDRGTSRQVNEDASYDLDDSYDLEEPYDSRTEQLEKQVKKSNRKGIIFDLLFYALLIFVCIYIIPNYVIQRTVVDGTSMENTLYDGDQLYVEKLSYHFDALKRFDIIVFYPYGRENKDYYVKRIIGLPGETVQIIGSDIYINGHILEEHYGKDPIEDPGRAAEPIKLADDEYFVLGDNRSVSKDSRSEDVGNVSRKNIGGRVIIRIKPLNRFGPVD